MKKASTVPAITELTQEDIPMMLEKVNKQLADLMPKELKTSKDVRVSGTKVSEMGSLDECIRAHSSIVEKTRAYKKSKTALGLDSVNMEDLKFSGRTPKEVMDALKARTVAIINEVAIREMKEIKTMLESNLSAKMKLSNDLNKMASRMESIKF